MKSRKYPLPPWLRCVDSIATCVIIGYSPFRILAGFDHQAENWSIRDDHQTHRNIGSEGHNKSQQVKPNIFRNCPLPLKMEQKSLPKLNIRFYAQKWLPSLHGGFLSDKKKLACNRNNPVLEENVINWYRNAQSYKYNKTFRLIDTKQDGISRNHF